ncbi:MAG: hypothetical protein AAB316_15990, partial [Bacteroidota bacterium]
CKSDPAANLQANFFIRYEQLEKKLRAEATFKSLSENQDSASQVSSGNVFFLGKQMTPHDLPGGVIRYEFEQIRTLEPDLDFRWQEGGTAKTSIAQVGEILDFKIQGDVVKKTGFILTFTGKPLAATEKLVLAFTDSQNQPVNVEMAGPTETPGVVVQPDKLAPLALGTASLYLVRTSQESRIEKGTEILLQTEFYTERQFFIVE